MFFQRIPIIGAYQINGSKAYLFYGYTQFFHR